MGFRKSISIYYLRWVYILKNRCYFDKYIDAFKDLVFGMEYDIDKMVGIIVDVFFEVVDIVLSPIQTNKQKTVQKCISNSKCK